MSQTGIDQGVHVYDVSTYHRLFSPPTADDARHDEALSSRIAALNLLELSLDHLGIQTRESADGGVKQDDIEMRNATVMGGLEDIVQAVGQGTCFCHYLVESGG